MRALVFLRTGGLALVLAVAGASFSGCDEEEPKPTTDGSVADAPAADTGTPDRAPDSATNDAPKEAGADTGGTDARDGGTDAVTPDGGTDAVTPDGGADADPPDTGTDATDA